MAGLSISLAHGATGMKMSDFTTGTLTPNAGDFEVRWNTTDTNGKNVLDLEVVIALKAIIRQIENGGGSATNLLPLSGGAAPPPLV